MTRYKLNNIEEERFKMCTILHQCPWWRKYFPKHKLGYRFIIHQSNSSGIGVNTDIECTECGKIYDITDYSNW